jgi:hypothetical protein
VAQDVNISVVPRSGFDRAMRRRDAIGLAILAALDLTASNADAASNGREVVRVAKRYRGSRYKSGGASPKGFDCSGFTWYVYKKAAGMDITRGVEEQWKRGRSVVVANCDPATWSSSRIRSSAVYRTSASSLEGTILFTPRTRRRASSSRVWNRITTGNTMRARAASFDLPRAGPDGDGAPDR